MTKTRSPFCLLSLLLLAGCAGAGRPPHAFLPPIAEEYHVCDQCGSLHGGIYGKGPLASFASPTASRCRHQWRPISKPEFQELAARRFPVEWQQAIPFLKQAGKATSTPAAAGATFR